MHQVLQDRKPTSVERFRLETLNYGIDFYEFNLRWYEKLAEREVSARPPHEKTVSF